MNLEEFRQKLRNSGYSEDQIAEIIAGIEADIDIREYCKVEFNAAQMREIRIGLQHGLYVSEYADSKFSAEQMWVMRYGKETGLDMSIFTGSLCRMITAFIAAQCDISISAYQMLDADQLCEVVLALHDGIDVKDIPVKDLDSLQIHEIILTKREGHDASSLLTRQDDGQYMSAIKMKEVRETLRLEKDLMDVCGPDFNAAQMREIKYGLMEGINVDVYCTRELSGAQMKQVRLGMQIGVDVSIYNDAGKYSAAVMRVIRRGLIEGVHPSMYLTDGMTSSEANDALQHVLNANENVHRSDGEITLSEDYLNQFL